MRTFSSLRLNDSQLEVLAKIIASPTPTVAEEAITTTPNLVAAKDILIDLGLIRVDNGQASLTDEGQQVAIDYNITDETGQLTDMGNQLASVNTQQQESFKSFISKRVTLINA